METVPESSRVESGPSDAAAVELPCFNADSCNVHVNVPPCTTLGHHAETWNVVKPDYTCELRTVTRGDSFIFRLLTQEGELFAEAHWDPRKPMSSVIDAAVDSSRYFALRIANPANPKLHVVIGIGFNDREVASQFKLTLAEHGRYLNRLRAVDADARASVESHRRSGEAHAGEPPAKDYSLKGNITVALPERAGSGGRVRALPDAPSLAAGPFGKLLPAPPSVRRGAAVAAQPRARGGGDGGGCGAAAAGAEARDTAAEQATACDDSEFGAFVG